MANKAICPACGEWLNLSNPSEIGQQLKCVHCEAELEVVELEPVELDWAYYEDDEEWDDEDEDWDDDDDDWDDDDWDDDDDA